MKKNIFKLFGIIALVTVIGLSITACPPADPGNTDPKELVLTMPTTIANYANPNGFFVLVLPKGTTGIYAANAVAGGDSDDFDIETSGSNMIITLPLYKVIGGNYDGSRWTGNGAYDIYAVLGSGTDHVYRRLNVNISSATTNITVSDADEFTIP